MISGGRTPSNERLRELSTKRAGFRLNEVIPGWRLRAQARRGYYHFMRTWLKAAIKSLSVRVVERLQRHVDVTYFGFFVIAVVAVPLAAIQFAGHNSPLWTTIGFVALVLAGVLLPVVIWLLDFQKGAVYDWGNKMAELQLKTEKYGNAPFDLNVLETIINDARQLYGASADWRATRRPLHWSLEWCFGQKSTGVELWLPKTIGFGRFYQHPIYAAHEAAHSLSRDAHGPHFARVFKHIVVELGLLDEVEVLKATKNLKRGTVIIGYDVVA